MAKVHIIRDDLKEKYNLYSFITSIGVTLAVTGIIMHLQFFVTHKFFLGTPFGAFLLLVPGVFIVANFSSKRDIAKAGIDAEEETVEIISNLPDEYSVFVNAEVTYEGRKSRMDMVVVGPTGIFVVETKSRKGDITGNADSKYLYQTKVSFESYTHKFYNPMKQVGTHVYRLSGHLKKNGIGTWVQGVVYFHTGFLEITGHSKIPYFEYPSDLVSYIKSRRPKVPFTLEMREKTEKILSQC